MDTTGTFTYIWGTIWSIDYRKAPRRHTKCLSQYVLPITVRCLRLPSTTFQRRRPMWRQPFRFSAHVPVPRFGMFSKWYPLVNCRKVIGKVPTIQYLWNVVETRHSKKIKWPFQLKLEREKRDSSILCLEREKESYQTHLSQPCDPRHFQL